MDTESIINEFTPRQLGNIESAVREAYIGMGVDTSNTGFQILDVWNDGFETIAASIKVSESVGSSTVYAHLFKEGENFFVR